MEEAVTKAILPAAGRGIENPELSARSRGYILKTERLRERPEG